MRRITLEIDRDDTPEKRYCRYTWDSLFEGESLSPVCRSFLDQAQRVFKPKSFEFIRTVSVSKGLSDEPHEVWFDYRTSLTNGDFEIGDELTAFGEYLKKVDGYIFSEGEEGDLELSDVSNESYWNPEWPRPVRIKLNWEHAEPPYDLTIVCAADSDEQLAHLLLHPHLDDLLVGMLPILEEFLNRRVQKFLRPEPVEA